MRNLLIHSMQFCSILLILFTLVMCNRKQEQRNLPFKTKKEYENTMIESHKVFLQKEEQRIEAYIDSSDLEFTRTGTGLRYSVYEQGNGDTLRSGDIAIVRYQLNLLNGDILYSTEEGKVQNFTVDFDSVESGLHEGIKLMRVGDKAILILPAHLAHGVTGDQAQIPSQATLVYNLHLVAKQ